MDSIIILELQIGVNDLHYDKFISNFLKNDDLYLNSPNLKNILFLYSFEQELNVLRGLSDIDFLDLKRYMPQLQSIWLQNNGTHNKYGDNLFEIKSQGSIKIYTNEYEFTIITKIEAECGSLSIFEDKILSWNFYSLKFIDIQKCWVR